MRSIDPMSGEVFAVWPMDTPVTLNETLAEVCASQRLWAERTVSSRIDSLSALAGRLREDVVEMSCAMTREMGKPITQARAEVTKGATLVDHYVAYGERYLEARSVDVGDDDARVVVEPLGVVLAIMPWNFPYWQVLRCVVPALIAGNAVVVKHAPRTQGCAERLRGHMILAGVPASCCPLVRVPEEEMAALIARDEVSAVALTGSTRAGRAVAQIAGAHLKPCVLELGGSDPLLVFEDADVEAAVKAAIWGRFQNTGQSCIASKRWIVHEAVAEAFLHGVVAACSELRMGDPTLEETQVGPLARVELALTLMEQVEESVRGGARVLCGGHRRGAFVEPTVLVDIPKGCPAETEELFGPVAAVWVEADEEAMIDRANATIYGLAASVWTTAERGMQISKRLACGAVSINQLSASDPRLPFGGVKASGWGRELGREGALAFVNVKAVRWSPSSPEGNDDA